MTDKIARYMKKYGITREEAIQLIEDDKAVEKMSDAELTADLTPEQKKASKEARQTSSEKPQKRERTPNEAKRNLISALEASLTTFGATEINVVNAERQIEFKVDGQLYRIVMSTPRS